MDARLTALEYFHLTFFYYLFRFYINVNRMTYFVELLCTM